MNQKHIWCGGAFFVAALFLGVQVEAQERTAGGPLQQQMSWSALSSQIESVRLYGQGLGARVDQIVLCGQSGKIYAPGSAEADANGCRNAASVSAASYTKIVMAQGGTGGGTSTAVATCPTGYVRTGCSGARNETMTDTCEEDKCGLVGAGPIGEASCKATVDGDKGTRATVWATCVKVTVN